MIKLKTEIEEEKHPMTEKHLVQTQHTLVGCAKVQSLMGCCRGAGSRGYSPSFAICEGSEKLKVDFSPQARGESWKCEEENK